MLLAGIVSTGRRAEPSDFAVPKGPGRVINTLDMSQNFAFSQAQPRTFSSRGVPIKCKSGIECPIHGEIKLPDEIAPILRTKPFKRLRKLKQLGVCSAVCCRQQNALRWLSLGHGNDGRPLSCFLASAMPARLRFRYPAAGIYQHFLFAICLHTIAPAFGFVAKIPMQRESYRWGNNCWH
jgi:hypothetical protein